MIAAVSKPCSPPISTAGPDVFEAQYRIADAGGDGIGG